MILTGSLKSSHTSMHTDSSVAFSPYSLSRGDLSRQLALWILSLPSMARIAVGLSHSHSIYRGFGWRV